MNTTNRIRILRKEMGLTQPELAAQTGISVHSINSYESGRRQPNSKAMAELERFLVYPVPTSEVKQTSVIQRSERTRALRRKLVRAMDNCFDR